MATVEGGAASVPDGGLTVPVTRMVGWIVVCSIFAFLVNTYLSLWWEFPGVTTTLASFGAEDGADVSVGLGIFQFAIFLLAVLGPVAFVFRTDRGLRTDAKAMSDIVTYLVRGAFWAVVFVGLADFVISFLRVEGMLGAFFGPDTVDAIGRSQTRGTMVHLPLIILGFVVGSFTRTLGVHWLALLVVVAELFIVLSRFVYSYEQAFQGDLVRFWYAALFLFASAYTLLEDGHVRVDVLYSGFSLRAKGLANAIGCVFLGMSLTMVILVFGMWEKTSTITSPLLSYEVSQSGFGMYVKYWMASFLGVFAVTMTIQFASYLLDSVADYRGEPGHHEGSHAIS